MSYIKLLDRHDPRLGRHVEHDARSRWYAYRGVPTIQTVQHVSYINVLDQGQLGSCTGNAAVGCLGYNPFWDTMGMQPLDEEMAQSIYSQATSLDEVPGVWPPTDTGSTGVAVSKALQSRGLISGYQWMFRFIDVIGALMARPVILGTAWYESMFDPDAFGMVGISGRVAGGHEYILDGWDADLEVAHLRNSWGPTWGVDGSFKMTGATLTRLLGEDGDAVIFTPSNLPAPEPVPPDPNADKGCLSWALGPIREWLP